jgi:hypothetical protein
MAEDADQGESRRCCRWFDYVAYAVPLLLIAGLVITYLVNPEFYLRYVLELQYREWQVVELVTVGSAFLGSLFLFYSAWRLWAIGPQVYATMKPDQPAWLKGRRGAVTIAVVALAAFFLAGEEINWGENLKYIGQSHDERGAADSEEFNLHNNDRLPISIAGLGTVFIGVIFIALPILWAFRHNLKFVLDDWAPAIAEGPMIFTIIVTFLWRNVKRVYLSFIDDPDQSGQFYREFIDQINEQKEMLIAVTLFMYGIYRLAAVKRLAKQVKDAEID